MLRRVVFVLMSSVASLGLPILATPVHAQPEKAGPGTAAVKEANDTISGLLKLKVTPGSKEEKDLAAKVTTSVRGFLDIDQLGKAAMIDQWSKLTKVEQDVFLKVLRELIEASYIKGLRSNVAYTVDYVGESPGADGNILVTTKVNAQRKGRPIAIAIDYVLVKSGKGLRAFDVKTEGVGLVENYRPMFNRLIKDKGFPALIETMKKKAAAIGTGATVPATTAKTP